VTDIEDERLMARFLVGDLAPAEQEAVEARLTADPAYFEAMCALEDELILRWHRGELSDRERELFERAYRTSPSRRARLVSGRLLIDAIDDLNRANEGRWFGWTRVLNWVATPRPVPQFMIATAVVLLLAAVPFALYKSSDVMRRGQVSFGESAALRDQLVRRGSVVLQLPPGTERGIEPPTTPVLKLPKNADEVWLQFDIADPGAAVGFDAILETMERTLAATTPRPVRVERTSGAAQVTLTVPAGELLDGDYVLKLQRRGVDRSSSIIATRTFRVMRE